MAAPLEAFVTHYDLATEDLPKWLIEAMVLGAVADGEIGDRESEEILSQVAAGSAYVGMGPDEFQANVERAFHSLVNDGFHVRIAALAAALPRYPERLLAFRAAVSVAMADNRLESAEVEYLRALQESFGITEADVVRAFEEAQCGDCGVCPDEVEPVEAFLDILLMAAAADRVVTEDELATIVAYVVTRPEFEGITEDHMHTYVREGLARYAASGVVEELEAVVERLSTEDERIAAWGLAAAIIAVDGSVSDEERAFLLLLQRALGLDDDQIAMMAGAMQGVAGQV